MVKLDAIVSFLDRNLRPDLFRDAAYNGLQVESSAGAVKRVAFAVDSGLSVIEEAVRAGAQLLVVHHGLFWGGAQPVTGALARKLELLLGKGCSLYASHLPLDAHPEYGNNAGLAKFFDLIVFGEFAQVDGRAIGVKAESASPRPMQYFIDRAQQMIGAGPILGLPFGPAEIRTAGIVTGSGAFAIHECAELGLDLFISGEPKQQVYHECRELRLNALFAGHYATETFGVLALKSLLEREYGIEGIFVDQPTGI